MTRLVEAQPLIDSYLCLVNPRRASIAPAPQVLPDVALIKAIQRDAEQHHLWDGHWDYGGGMLGPKPYGSQSEADYALLGHILSLARKRGVPRSSVDAVMIAVFESSGLYRPEKHNRVLKQDIPNLIASSYTAMDARTALPCQNVSRLGGGEIGFSSSLPKPRDYVLDEVILAGKPYILAGLGGVSKTMWAMTLAVHVALGRDFLGKGTSCGSVLLILGEEDQDEVNRRFNAIAHDLNLSEAEVDILRQRIRALPLQGVDIRMTTQVYGSLEPTSFVDEVGQAASALAASSGLSTRLVVVDHAGLIHGGEFNTREDVVQTTKELQRLTALTGAATLLLAHSPKDARRDDSADASHVTGSSAWIDHARGAFILRSMRENDAKIWGVPPPAAANYVSLTVVKNNYGPTGKQFWFQRRALPDYSVAVLNYVNFASAPSKTKAQALPQRIKALIAQHPGRYTRTSLRDLCSGKARGLAASKSDVATATDELLRLGELRLVPPTPAQRQQYKLRPQVKEVLEVSP